jgi:hypothetical protein
MPQVVDRMMAIPDAGSIGAMRARAGSAAGSADQLEPTSTPARR